MSLDITLLTHSESNTVYTANITHNFSRMAAESGIYEALWHPEEIGIVKAKDLIPFLRSSLDQLSDDPEKYRALEPSNEWGTYEEFMDFLGELLEACENKPNAVVEVSR